MRRLCTLLVCIVIFLTTKAQTENYPGLIVKKSGDSIRGFLSEEGAKDMAISILFKDKSQQTWQKISPNDISGFQYDNGNIYQVISFKNTFTDSISDDTRFVKLLVTGTYTLYSFQENETKFFVIKNSAVTYLLFNTVYFGYGDVKKEGNYQNRLFQLAGSCPQPLFPEKVGYVETQMSKFIVNLNNCVSPGSSSQSYYHKPPVSFEENIYAGADPIPNHLAVTVDAGVRMYYPQFGKGTSINLSLHYSHAESKTDERNFGNTLFHVLVKHDIIALPLTVRYDILQGRIRPYVNLGVAPAYIHDFTSNSPFFNGAKNYFELYVVVSGGVEGYITDKFSVRADWYWYFLGIGQYPTLGISYHFTGRKNKK